MQSRIVVNSQEESLLSTHKVLRNTYFLLGLTMAFFGSCCLYLYELKLALSKSYRIARGLLRFTFCDKPFSKQCLGDLSCIRVHWVYGLYHRANFKHVCGERNGRFNYACIRRYSNRLLCLFSLCANNKERYVFPFYRNFLIIYRVIVRDCGKLLLPNPSTSGRDQCIVCGILNNDNPL